MNFQLAIYTVLLLSADVLGKINERIIGGENVNIINYSFMASLRMKNTLQHFCGGVIISKCHILTAAHCLDDVSHDNIIIKIGSNSSRNTRGLYYQIEYAYIHPDYTGKISDDSILVHDIAVLKIDKNIEFNELQKKINLPIRNYFGNNDAMVLGWGFTSHPIGTTSMFLKKARMKTLFNMDCSNITKFKIQYEQICAYNTVGIGACHGDSGGPLISSRNELIGITSFIRPCAVGLPDIYTRVYSYQDFIRTIIHDYI